MAKLVRNALVASTVLSLVSLFSGSPVPVSLIIGLLTAAVSVDFLFIEVGAGTITASSIREYALAQRLREKRSFITLCAAIIATGAVTIYAIPSFSAGDSITIPDIRGLKPFSADTNYMSYEGFVATYLRMHGREVTRAEARSLVKQLLSMKDEAPLAMAAPERPKAAECSPEPECAPAPCKKAMTLREYDATRCEGHRSRMLTRREAPGRVNECGARVAVLPFVNHTDNDYAVERVMRSVMAEFSRKGYRVASASDVMEKAGSCYGCGEGDMARIAAALDADVVVTGEILKYRHDRKFRLAGFLVGNVVSGWHNYGDIQLNTKIYRASDASYVYCDSFSKHEKQQLMGLFNSSGRAMGRSVDEAVDHLYAGYGWHDRALRCEAKKECAGACTCHECFTKSHCFHEYYRGRGHEPRIEITNPTRHAMIVKFTSRDDYKVYTLNVQPRSENDIDLPAGDYNYYMFSTSDPSVNSPHETVCFKSGHYYKMPIVSECRSAGCRPSNREVALAF